MGKKMVTKAFYRLVRKDRVTREEVLESAKGRFHDDGDPPTTYVADGPATAKKEVEARAGARLDPRGVRLWKVHCQLLSDLLNLLDKESRAREGVTLDELTADPPADEGLDFAKAVRSKGVAGFIYPSIRNAPDGMCVVLFLEHAGWAIELEPADEEWDEFVRAAGFSQ